jgi:nucleoside-diphosphate-sugar epimerase
VEFVPHRDWDRSLARLGSTRKARARLGFETRVSLEDGLRETVRWTRENLDFIERCMYKHHDLCPVAA